MTVLICGATGTTGSALLRQLRGDQVPVRAMTRSQESAAKLGNEGIETVVADLADPSSLPAALEGIDAVYVASPSDVPFADNEGNLARAAAQAGVGHLVKLSVIGAGPDSPLVFARAHHAGEEAVRAAGVPWTMLRPNGFMQNTLSWARQIPSATIRGPVVNARWSIVDVRDIAAVAARVLESPTDHAGQAYTLTGPEASSPHEQVEILSELLEIPLEAVDLPIDTVLETMRSSGVDGETLTALRGLWEMYATGQAEEVSPDVERVTGRPAYTYRQFAEDHKTLFLEG